MGCGPMGSTLVLFPRLYFRLHGGRLLRVTVKLLR